jgi:beta-lactamase class A
MIRARSGCLPILSLLIVGVTASAAPMAAARVQTDIDQLAKISGGRVGVAAWRVDGKGPQILSNADERFPMASTFKIAVAGRHRCDNAP